MPGGEDLFKGVSVQVESVERRLRTGAGEDLAEADSGRLLPERAGLEDRIEAFLRGEGVSGGVPEQIRADVEAAVRLLYDGIQPPAPGRTGMALEMVVVADGARPVFFFENGSLVKGAGNGDFVDVVQRNAAVLETASLSVGRLESDVRLAPSWTDKWFAGTAFLVGPDLVMTNRHVVQEIVNETSDGGPFTLNGPYWINFNAEFGAAGRRRVAVKEVVFTGPQVIDGLDLSRLDMALIRLGAAEDGAALPAPLAVSAAPVAKGQPVFVTGYPGRPKVQYGGDPAADAELETVLIDLFDRRFGGKRCASGEIDALPGTFAEDVKRWTVQHDASTLGGNSGSPIMTLVDGGVAVQALHFGGASRIANYGHVFEQAADRLRALGVVLR